MRKRGILIFLLLIACSFRAYGQWKQVLNVPGKPVYSVYFLEESSGIPRIGFAGIGSEIWRTEDAGQTWTKTTSTVFAPCQFTFKDTLIGWCASRGDGIYKTIDGGRNWSSLNLGQRCEGVYFNKLSKRLFYASWAGNAGYSDDEGLSWITIVNDGHGYSGIDFTSANNGVITSYDLQGRPWLITNDGGLTWSHTPFGKECWQVLALAGTSTLFAACEPGAGNFRSNDNGDTWNKAPDIALDGYLTGDIHGDLCRMYLQTFNWYGDPFLKAGIYRSFDQGVSWQFINGPANWFDRRFYAKDKYIYAGDSVGGVWFLYDSIPLTLVNDINLSQDSVNFGNVLDCQDRMVKLDIKNIFNCFDAHLTNIKWIITGANPFSVIHPSDSLRTIKSQMNDSLLIHFANIGSGSYKAKLKIRFNIDGKLYDTIINVIGVRKLGPTATLSSLNLEFDIVAICTPKDLSAVVVNSGCDTETISLINLPANYQVIQPITPVTLYPGDTVAIVIRMLSSIPGKHNENITVLVTPMHLPQISIEMSLNGFIVDEFPAPELSPPVLNFDSVSVCDSTAPIQFIIHNLSHCDYLDIDSLWIEDDSFFFPPNSKGFIIPPSTSGTFKVYVKNLTEGLHQGTYHIRYRKGKVLVDTTLPLSIFVRPGKALLSAPLTFFDFGSISVCDERDTLVKLTNTGCDTLVISGIGFRGSGFGTNAVFPIILLPKTDTSIDIFTLLDTAGGKTVTRDTITFQSNADNTLAPIPLSRTFIQSTHRDVGLNIDPAAKSGGDLTLVSYDIKETSGKTFSGAGIKNVAFGLNYNSDLLIFDQTKSSNVTSSDGKSFTITGNPITADANGVLATIGFMVYLTKDSVTQITMTNRTDTMALSCGMMTLSMGGSATFDYNYLCGERSLAGFLSGTLPLKITSLHPNPAQDEFELDLESPVKQNAQLEIFDALGAKVFSTSKEMAAGSNSLHVSTKNLPSGMYLVRVGRVSQSLVISR